MTAALLFALVAGTALVYAQRRAASRIQEMSKTLGELQTWAIGQPLPDLDDAPPVVRRYLKLVLPLDVASPASVTLKQHGRLRSSPTSSRWMPFTANHMVNPSARRFLWNAKVKAAPFVHLRVLDTLIAGQGSGQVLLLSAFDVGHDSGTPEMNSGALHRFLAEAVWYPWALLPSEHLRWTPLDTNRALATMTADGVTVELEFRFADSGEVVGIYTPARWCSFDGRYAQVALEGHFSGYERRHGVLVPNQGEVGWYHKGRLGIVWQGYIDSMTIHWNLSAGLELLKLKP